VTNSTFPRTIPLQAGLQKPLTPIVTEGTAGVGKEQVKAELQGGVYKVPGRELTSTSRSRTHFGADPSWRIHHGWPALPEPDVFTTKPEFPDYLLATAACRPTRPDRARRDQGNRGQGPGRALGHRASVGSGLRHRQPGGCLFLFFTPSESASRLKSATGHSEVRRWRHALIEKIR